MLSFSGALHAARLPMLLLSDNSCQLTVRQLLRVVSVTNPHLLHAQLVYPIAFELVSQRGTKRVTRCACDMNPKGAWGRQASSCMSSSISIYTLDELF